MNAWKSMVWKSMAWPRNRLLAVCLLAATGLLAQVVKRTPQSEVIQQLGLVIPMRDGIRLAGDLYLPRAGGRYGTILIRTPYNRKAGALGTYQFFTSRGYAVVMEDVRGRYASQGVFGPTEQEGPDSSDTMNWISEQSWSNGRVAMAGSSYLGMVQWWAAVQDNPHLVTISPMCSGDDEYLDRFYSTGGALKLGHRLLWLAQNLTPPSKVRPVFAGYIWHLPERTADEAAMGAPLPLWRSALDHPSYDSYWKPFSLRDQLKRVAIPILSLGGWFDNYAESDLDAFSRLSKRHDRIETWIGPWAHNPGFKFATRDFGPQAVVPIRLKQAEWFDRWMKGEANEGDEADVPSLHIFVMGPNVWREEHEWPLARTRYTPLYLNSKGHANSASGDGTLAWAPVRKSQLDTFTYDPKFPVPTMGGAICCDPKLLPPGPLDQTVVEARPDVLVYTSAPLTEDIEVTGPVRAILYVATSANDTDFTAKLVDVQPDGRPMIVTDGIQRLRYRLSLEKPVFVKRNTAYQISVDAGVTSYVFTAGHRIRLEVSSSNFPRFDRNLNSALPVSDEIKVIKAKQTVFHEKGYPSAVILPVIPARPNGPKANAKPAETRRAVG
jgi:putative CocE/NonD family hydrolase